ncbi:MAG: hypothetical protein PHZ09_03715 [Eubacteriales bacterium]|nr:hypothetical protein [Eubacteriales bacterium]
MILLTVFFSAAILILTACASDTTITAQTTILEETAPAEETQPQLIIPEADLMGADYTLLVPASVGWVNSRDFIYDEGLKGEPVNDAVHDRILNAEETFNCTIIGLQSSSLIADARSEIMSGGNQYQVIMPAMTEVKTLAGEGLLLDLRRIETVRLNQPWWSQNANGNLSIGGSLYFTLGDISLIDNDGIAAIGFNKSLIEDNNLEPPYAMAYDGTWTMERMYDMCKGLNRDLNGDGKLDGSDQYGFVTDHANIVAFIYASGETIISKDEKDMPYPSIYNERVSAVIDLITAFANDETAFGQTSIFGDHGKANTNFMNNQMLFRLSSMFRFTQMRAMESDFGFLPMPKYEESQENYHHSYSYASPGISLPITLDFPAVTGAVLEALAYWGRYTVLPAYYEINLQTKVARDEDSAGMLDIIFDAATFDLGLIYNFGGIRDIFEPFVRSNTNNFASVYASIEQKINTEIDTLIETFDNLK